MLFESLNCPNCGAPIVGDKCEYCGTVFKFVNEKKKTILPPNHYKQLDQIRKDEIVDFLAKHSRKKHKILWFYYETPSTSFSASEIIEELQLDISIQKISCLLLFLEREGLIKKVIDNGRAMWYI